ncbi:MAG: hypothetical protein WCL39_01305 [Armatimonadota bacterium]
MRRALSIVCILALAVGTSHAQGLREATRIVVGETTHFSLDKDEQTDFAVQLGAGSYVILWDVKRLDEAISNIMAHVDLLKSNGTMIKSGVLRANELHAVARVLGKTQQAKPLAARLRVTNDDAPLEVWMTVLPAAQLKWRPFAWGLVEMKPLAIGTEGKGASLEKKEYAFHEIKLDPGKYDVSLYFKRQDRASSNCMGDLDRLSSLGVQVPQWRLSLNEIGKEARQEKRLVITKPQNVILRVTNIDAPVEYIIGIAKATD